MTPLDVLAFLNTWGGIVGVTVGIITSVGWFLEHRFHLRSLWRKTMARIMGKPTFATFRLECLPATSFSDLKERICARFRQDPHFTVKHDGPIRMEVIYAGIPLRILHEGGGNVVLMAERARTTLGGLQEAVQDLLAVVDDLSTAVDGTQPALGAVVGIDLAVELPYEWEGITVRERGEYQVKQYSVEFAPGTSSAKGAQVNRVSVTLRKVHFTTRSTSGLMPLVKQFV